MGAVDKAVFKKRQRGMKPREQAQVKPAEDAPNLPM